MMALTSSIKALHRVLRHAQSRGVRAEDYFRAVGFHQASRLEDPHARISYDLLVRFFEVGAELTGDPNFGLHVALSHSPSDFDLIGFIVFNSPTLGDALAQTIRFSHLWTTGATLEMEADGPLVHLRHRYRDPRHRVRRQVSEVVAATMLGVARAGTRTHVIPVLAEFSHPAPADLAEHRRLFQCPLIFSAPINRITLKAESLELPMHGAESELQRVLIRQAETYLESTHDEGIVDPVRRLIVRSLQDGEPTMEAVAERLAMSPRTLQRKLHEANTGFKDLLDEVRWEKAVACLAIPGMSLAEVSYLLGYSELTAFYRAFKRWTGQTPRQYGIRTGRHELTR